MKFKFKDHFKNCFDIISVKRGIKLTLFPTLAPERLLNGQGCYRSRFSFDDGEFITLKKEMEWNQIEFLFVASVYFKIK